MLTNQMTNRFDEIPIVQNQAYWIWLASWYPSKTFPTNGDFIQRHATAVSNMHPLILIHCVHDVNLTTPYYYHYNTNGNLIEIIIYFAHHGQTTRIMDKLVYNFLFYKHATQFIYSLFRKIAKPLFVHVHVPMKMGLVARWIKKKWQIPYFVSEQSSAYVPLAPDSFIKRNLYYKQQVKNIFKNALAITNVSATIGETIKKLFHLKEITVIHNQADTTVFQYKKKVDQIFRFIHVSTMGYQKNFSGLMHTFNRLSEIRNDFELVLVGAIPEDAQELLKQSLELFTVHPVGTINNQEVAFHIQQANCMVLFSRSENFPCVIVESLCCGVPVITSNAGGAAEAINTHNGIVVPSEDEEALLMALLNMLDNFHQYNQVDIAMNAENLYCAETIAKQFSTLYKQYGVIK
jgi:glycosyltransferase involved in cell wall biosynthesis